MTRLGIYGYIICICLTVPFVGYAGVPVMDAKGQATGVYGKVQSLANQVVNEMIKTSEENIEESKKGNADCDKSLSSTKAKKSMTADVFEYVKDHVLDQKRDKADVIIAPSPSYTENRKLVKETFYAMGNEGSDLTDLGETVNKFTSAVGVNISPKGYSASDVEKVRKTREEYASQVAAKNLEIAVELRERVADDLKSVGTSETKGCNQLQGHMYENRGMGTLIKGTASDIVIQILTLESLGAKVLLKNDAGFLPVPADPNEEEKEGEGTAIGRLAGKATSIGLSK